MAGMSLTWARSQLSNLCPSFHASRGLSRRTACSFLCLWLYKKIKLEILLVSPRLSPGQQRSGPLNRREIGTSTEGLWSEVGVEKWQDIHGRHRQGPDFRRRDLEASYLFIYLSFFSTIIISACLSQKAAFGIKMKRLFSGITFQRQGEKRSYWDSLTVTAHYFSSNYYANLLLKKQRETNNNNNNKTCRFGLIILYLRNKKV